MTKEIGSEIFKREEEIKVESSEEKVVAFVARVLNLPHLLLLFAELGLFSL